VHGPKAAAPVAWAQNKNHQWKRGTSQNFPRMHTLCFFARFAQICTDSSRKARQIQDHWFIRKPVSFGRRCQRNGGLTTSRRQSKTNSGSKQKKKAWIDSGNQFVWHTSRAKTKRSRSSLTPNQSPAGTAAGSSQKRNRVGNRGPPNRSGNRKKPVNDIPAFNPAFDMDPANPQAQLVAHSAPAGRSGNRKKPVNDIPAFDEGFPMDLPLDFPAIVAVGRGGQRRALLKKPVANNRSRRQQRPTKDDPNRPKKPAGGGYFVYLKDRRPQIIQELGPNSKGATDISKVAASQWKAMTAEEKKPYEEKYRQKQEEYVSSMRAYVQTAAPARGGDLPVATAQDSGPPIAAEKDLQKDLE